MVATRSAVSKVLSTVAARTVHLKVQPMPRNLHESRQVLHIIKEFGQVTMFRNLRHNTTHPAPNSILVIFQASDAVSKLLAESPLRFTVPPPQPQAAVASTASFGIPIIFGSSKTSSDAIMRGDQHMDGDSFTKAGSREFFLSADKSFADCQAIIERQPYYWGFNESTKSFAYDDLMKSVPMEGLATFSAFPKTLPNRIVKQNVSKIRDRRSLRQLRFDASPPPT